jgi:hypothetical protein
MIKRNILLLCLLVLVSQNGASQINSKTNKIESLLSFKDRYLIDIDHYSIIGLSGFNNFSLEFGYTNRIDYLKNKRTQKNYSFSAIFQASLETELYPNFQINPKLSNKYFIGNRYESNFQILLGTDFLFSNDFHTINYVVRPIIGTHFFLGMTFTYGYNIKLDNNPSILSAQHNFSLIIPLFFPFLFIPE